MDHRVMNKCPTFSGRDTEWSGWSFIFESVASMDNLEPAMEGAFTELAEKPLAELTLEMKLSAKLLCCFLVNTVRGKAPTLVRSTEKHHGLAVWKRKSRPSTSQMQQDGTQQFSWESCNLFEILAVQQTVSGPIDGMGTTNPRVRR